MQSPPYEIEAALSRDLGLTSALAIGMGTMIAAGIFTLSGLAVSNVGSAAVAAFLAAAVVALFTALTYCEFASIYPESGEGYLYARKTFSPLAAYFVGGSLVLGYTSSCAFYIASFSSYFQEFVWHSPIPAASGLVALFGLTLLNIKGTKESGTFQIVVTGAKVILLCWFVIGGLGAVDTGRLVERFDTDLVKIGGTAAMVFITFFGFSAIAASAGEVRDPVRTIPRAIFLSMASVTVLYVMVVLVVVSADLSEYSESAMGTVAKMFLGPVGGMVIVGGALFSMISASNASIMAGSRVAMSMSRMGHLPRAVGAIDPQTRTPIVATLLVGSLIMIFSLTLPLVGLAQFANTVLLVALILVNAALVWHRRLFPDLERPFRVPLVPLVPLLGIAANLYLLSQLLTHPMPVAMAFASLLLAVLGYLAWKGSLVQEDALPGPPSRVVLQQAEPSEDCYRVLVPIANPQTVQRLVSLAVALSAGKKSEIIVLRVIEVPEQLEPRVEQADIEREREVLEIARVTGQELGVSIRTMVRVGHNAARAILETAREQRCGLVMLGWKGYTSTARRFLGEVTDLVVTHARCDIILVKLVGDQVPRRLLLPWAGGKHARRALGYATALASQAGGSLKILRVVEPDADEALVTRAEQDLAGAAGTVEGVEIQTRVLPASSPTEAILSEAEGLDALVVGATGRSFYPQVLFGSITEDVARRSPCSVIVVKAYRPVKAMVGRVIAE